MMDFPFKLKNSFLQKLVNIDTILNIFFSGFFIFLILSGLSSIDTSWDSLAYHLPFAARLVGIFPADGLILHFNLEDRFRGFPVLGEFLQGVFWRIYGHPSAANILGTIALILSIYIICKLLKLKFWKVSLFILSIPLVLIHTTSAYLDLFSCSILTLEYVIIFSFVTRKNFRIRNYLVIFLLSAVVCNTKLLLVPCALIGILLMFVFDLLYLYKEEKIFINKNLILKLIIAGFILPVMLFTYTKNTVKYKNPVFPYSAQIGWIQLEGTDPGISKTLEIQREHKDSKIKRFFLSFFEYYNYEYNNGRLFSIDQSQPDKDSKSFKVGGFFVANIILWGVYVFYIAIKHKDKLAGRLLLSICILLLFAAFLIPTSRYLRYLLFWPMIFGIFTSWLEQRYHNKEKSLNQFFVILQIFIFLFVVRHSYYALEPKKASNFEGYKLNTEAASVCIVSSDNRKALLYKLGNPDKRIQEVKDISECREGDFVVEK